MDRLVEVWIARDLIHANVLVGSLQAEGIEARVTNEHLQGVLGDIPTGFATAPRVLVFASDAERARKLLEDRELPRPREDGEG